MRASLFPRLGALALAAALAGCSAAAPAPTPTPAPTTAPTSAPTAAPTASPLPTAAPDPLPGPDAATSAAMAEALLARRGTATDLPLVGLVAEAEETDAGTTLLAYRVEDLLTPQPVPGETAALPVWQDTSWQPNGVPAIGLTEEEMRALADEAAETLGAEILSYETLTPHESIEALDLPGVTRDSVYGVQAEASGLRIKVWGDGELAVWFDAARPLPDGFAPPADEATGTALAAHWGEALAGLLGYAAPEALWYTTDADIYGALTPTVLVYESAADPVESYLNRTLAPTALYFNESGALTGLRRESLRACERLGDYPLLTADEARALLLAGEGFGGEAPAAEAIEAVELGYAGGAYKLPCYRFYVRNEAAPMPDPLAAVLTPYTVHLVLAIDTAYWGESTPIGPRYGEP